MKDSKPTNKITTGMIADAHLYLGIVLTYAGIASLGRPDIALIVVGLELTILGLLLGLRRSS